LHADHPVTANTTGRTAPGRRAGSDAGRRPPVDSLRVPRRSLRRMGPRRLALAAEALVPPRHPHRTPPPRRSPRPLARRRRTTHQTRPSLRDTIRQPFSRTTYRVPRGSTAARARRQRAASDTRTRRRPTVRCGDAAAPSVAADLRDYEHKRATDAGRARRAAAAPGGRLGPVPLQHRILRGRTPPPSARWNPPFCQAPRVRRSRHRVRLSGTSRLLSGESIRNQEDAHNRPQLWSNHRNRR
jgi:hypothetical protein